MAYYLKKEQWVNIPIDQAWIFFSSPQNLAKITPENLGFKILNEPPKEMYEGVIIQYKITPILKIPMTWVTEITHIKHLSYFVDEQRSGPYKMWHHEHFFEEKDGGTLMTDILHYELPFGIFGKLAHFFFVKAKVASIFNHREKILSEIF